jgi:hypothetical protein
MPVNSTHFDYDSSLVQWSRARDVLAGEDSVKAAGERYLPRLDSQSNEDYSAYKCRASFFNATARTAEGYSGLIFRRPPFVVIPAVDGGSSSATNANHFSNDILRIAKQRRRHHIHIINKISQRPSNPRSSRRQEAPIFRFN